MDIEAAFEITVLEGAGDRVDRFLAAEAPDYSRSLYSRLIKEGLVLVNGRPCKPSLRVKAGSLLTVTVPRPRLPEIVAEPIPIDVVYEDGEMLVVNKPPGLVVHPAYGHECGTLVNALLHRAETLSGVNGPERPGIVHRLDRDTSGLILIAKNDRAHEMLASQFSDRTIRKEYLAIVTGKVKDDEGTIDAPIGRSLADRKKMAIRHDRGRDSVTGYRVEERFEGFTLLRCFPKTGRTHQIRVHMRVLGFPVLCDQTYSRRKALFESELRGKKKREHDETPLIERQALHAAKISFTHPSGKEMELKQALPLDMSDTLAALKKFRSK